jgi:tRNA-modifying protein YgfZ
VAADSAGMTLAGAVPAPANDLDVGVPWHYGDPLGEQRSWLAGDGVADLSHRPVVRVSGSDRLSWLHSLISQHVESLAPQVAVDGLVLSPHGHVEHYLSMIDDGDSTWMHVEPGTADALVQFLDSMRFLLRVEVEDVSADWVAVAEPTAFDADGYLTRVLGDRREVFVPRSGLARYFGSAGRPVGTWALEALRVADGRARFMRDTDHRTIPHEVGWLERAVHLDKGCYRGQETVARVHNLGRPPRRLARLHLDGSSDSLPVHGDAITRDDRAVGFIGTMAQHYELGPVALGLLKSNVPGDAVVHVDGHAMTQDVLVEV